MLTQFTTPTFARAFRFLISRHRPESSSTPKVSRVMLAEQARRERKELEEYINVRCVMLFKAVEQTMGNAGYLSGNYTYKVMPHNVTATKFIVMLEIPHEIFIKTESLMNFEEAIKNSASQVYEINVRSVYWSCRSKPAAREPDPTRGIEVSGENAATDEEILEFKRQLEMASIPGVAVSTKKSRKEKSARPEKTGHTEWEDTELMSPIQDASR